MTDDKLLIRELDVAIPSIDDVRAAIKVLFEHDQVVELRGLGMIAGGTPKKFTLFGFYDDHEILAHDPVKVCETPGIIGTYFTLQRIEPALLLRSPNRLNLPRSDCR